MTRASEQLEAVRDILRAISESPFDLDGVLGTVVERLVKLCRASFGMIYVPIVRPVDAFDLVRPRDSQAG